MARLIRRTAGPFVHVFGEASGGLGEFQSGADDGTRTIGLLLRLPRWLSRRVLGTEWFREVGRDPGGVVLDDVFASLR